MGSKKLRFHHETMRALSRGELSGVIGGIKLSYNDEQVGNCTSYSAFSNCCPGGASDATICVWCDTVTC